MTTPASPPPTKSDPSGKSPKTAKGQSGGETEKKAGNTGLRQPKGRAGKDDKKHAEAVAAERQRELQARKEKDQKVAAEHETADRQRELQAKVAKIANDRKEKQEKQDGVDAPGAKTPPPPAKTLPSTGTPTAATATPPPTKTQPSATAAKGSPETQPAVDKTGAAAALPPAQPQPATGPPTSATATPPPAKTQPSGTSAKGSPETQPATSKTADTASPPPAKTQPSGKTPTGSPGTTATGGTAADLKADRQRELAEQTKLAKEKKAEKEAIRLELERKEELEKLKNSEPVLYERKKREDAEKELEKFKSKSEKAVKKVQNKVDALEQQIAQLNAQIGAGGPESLEYPGRLFVTGADDLEGTYKIDPGVLANEKPIWKSISRDQWIFSGLGGQWFIGDDNERDQNFKCDTGIVASREKHNDKLPQQMGVGGWMQYTDGQWADNYEINLLSLTDNGATTFMRIYGDEIGTIVGTQLASEYNRELTRVHFFEWLKLLFQSQIKDYVSRNEQQSAISDKKMDEATRARDEAARRTRVWSAMGPFLARIFSVWYFEVIIDGPFGIKSELRDKQKLFSMRIFRLRNRIIGTLVQGWCWRSWVIWASGVAKEFDQLGAAEYAFKRAYTKGLLTRTVFAWRVVLVQGRMFNRIRQYEKDIEDVSIDGENKILTLRRQMSSLLSKMTRDDPRKLNLWRTLGNWAAAVRWQVESSSFDDRNEALYEQLAELRIQVHSTPKRPNQQSESATFSTATPRGRNAGNVSEAYTGPLGTTTSRGQNAGNAGDAYGGYQHGEASSKEPDVAAAVITGGSSDLWTRLHDMEKSIETYTNRVSEPIGREESLSTPIQSAEVTQRPTAGGLPMGGTATSVASTHPPANARGRGAGAGQGRIL